MNRASPIRTYHRLFTFGVSARLSIYRKLSSFMRGGLPINDVIEKIAAEYRKHKDPLATVLMDWVHSMSTGKSLSEALQGWAPPGEVSMIRAGETSGDISQGLDNATMATESVVEMRKTIRKNLTYPAVLLTVAMALVYLFSTQGIPKLAELYEPSKWPYLSRQLYDFAMFVQSDWPVILLGAGLVVAVLYASLNLVVGPVRSILDQAPPWSIYKAVQSSIFLISLSSMMKSGIAVSESLAILQRLSGPYTRWQLKRIRTRINAGQSIGEALDTDFFAKDVRIDLNVYSALSDLHEAFDRLGRQAIDSSLASINAGAKLINTLVLLFIAAYVGWVYSSFFTLTQQIVAANRVM